MKFDQEEQAMLQALEDDVLHLRKPEDAEWVLFKAAAINTFNSTGV